MSGTNQPTTQEAFLEEPKKIPDMLNVLTILTFVGSGLGALSQIYYSFNAKKVYDMTIANQDKMADAPSWARSLQGPDPIGVATRTYDNRVAILILGVVALVLCIYGAIMMRQLKKSGFYLYLIGEILPLIATFIFIGAAAMTGLAFIFTIIFTALFIILYATQLKYLK
jgi:hypothetical protein